MSKKKGKVIVKFIGNNATSVTGSATLISFEDRNILFECGGIQEGRTTYDNYKLNREQISKIKAKDIDMIIGGHFMHYDHGGNVPAIVKQNSNIRIITPADTKGILREMWLDSANIMTRDCEELERKYPEKSFQPFYFIDDVETTLKRTEEYIVGEIHKLDDNVSIRYVYSGHIFGACQCELFIKCGGKVHKILFTSDLGNVAIQDWKPFVQRFEPVYNSNIAICESTYGLNNNKINSKSVQKDLDKIKTVIDQYCNDNNRRVLMPVFSLDKCPTVLFLIYSMFKDQPNFKTKVLVDSPLTNRLLDAYKSVLANSALEQFEEMLAWDNLVRITDPEESKYAMEHWTNICVLSSGGMLQSGRSVRWARELLPHSNDCLILSGYCGENTLGWKIKNCSDQKTINIGGVPVKNKAQIVNITSLSSHMQQEDLIKYYSSMHTGKIYLVHGDMDAKISLAKDLKERISNNSMSTGVCVVNKGTTITL